MTASAPPMKAQIGYGLIGIGLLASSTFVAPRIPAELVGYEMRSGSWLPGAIGSPAPVRTAYALHVPNVHRSRFAGQGNSSALIRSIREQSGLTWDQLARLFGVSRRSVHLWASGGRLNAAHQELLSEVLSIVRKLDANTPAMRRVQLFTPGPDGISAFDEVRSRHASKDGDVNPSPAQE